MTDLLEIAAAKGYQAGRRLWGPEMNPYKENDPEYLEWEKNRKQGLATMMPRKAIFG